jgi:hypothetical protein
MSSDLDILVETEARLDRELAEARVRAAAVLEGARKHAEDATAALATELANDRARIAATIAADTERELAAIAENASRAIARYEAIRGERLDPIARRLAARIVALAAEESA